MVAKVDPSVCTFDIDSSLERLKSLGSDERIFQLSREREEKGALSLKTQLLRMRGACETVMCLKAGIPYMSCLKAKVPVLVGENRSFPDITTYIRSYSIYRDK